MALKSCFKGISSSAVFVLKHSVITNMVKLAVFGVLLLNRLSNSGYRQEPSFR